MANVSEKKKKLLLLAKLLLEGTDEQHCLTLPQLLQRLEESGVSAERKSIYDDLETLRDAGLAIATRKTRSFGYYVERRPFTVEELTVLSLALRERAALPPEETEALVEKLCGLCSVHQAPLVRRAAVLAGEAPRRESAPKEKITLEFVPAAQARVLARFGPSLKPEPAGKNRLKLTVRAARDEDLLAWLFLQGADVRLTAPKKLAEQLRERAKTVSKLYK